MDSISIKRIELLDPALRKEATEILEWAWKKGIRLRYTHTLRTFAEQDALYAQGRTKSGKVVTKAKAGQSYHNYGLAIDITLLSEDGKSLIWDLKHDGKDLGVAPDWLEVAEEFKKRGWVWGGDFKRFKDYPHFEKTGNKSHRTLLAEYQARGNKLSY